MYCNYNFQYFLFKFFTPQSLHLIGLNDDKSESPGAFFGVTADKGLSRNPVQECKDYDNLTFVSILNPQQFFD